ncbi:hypothetical protein V3C99_008364 [Haemonchus contortus]
MKLITTLMAYFAMAYCHDNANFLKVRKYKCFEIPDDVDIQLVPKGSTSLSQPQDEILSSGSAHMGGQSVAEEDFETPQAHKVLLKKGNSEGHNPISKMQDVPRDKSGRVLLLSPAHCKQVEHYASSYGVSDVLKWVGRNCSFAKMFLPTATCEEINTLVASCYKNNQ